MPEELSPKGLREYSVQLSQLVRGATVRECDIVLFVINDAGGSVLYVEFVSLSKRRYGRQLMYRVKSKVQESSPLEVRMSASSYPGTAVRGFDANRDVGSFKDGTCVVQLRNWGMQVCFVISRSLVVTIDA